MDRTKGSQLFALGSKLPKFRLKNVDGKEFGSNELVGAKGILVAFTCNHCPYVKGSEEMLCSLVREFAGSGLKAVAINSNDFVQYPEDSFEKMQEKAKAMRLPYPYLLDETQEIAKLFDAACTPECYLFDSQLTLIYHGAINDSHKDPAAVIESHLELALKQYFSGQHPQPAFVHPIGCSIKWK